MINNQYEIKYIIIQVLLTFLIALIPIYFYLDASFENQSNYYPITSYKYIVNTYEQGSEVANKMETALENLYRVYFDTVTVKVNHDLSKDNSMYLYSIEIIAYYNKVKYEITREMSEKIITKF